MSPIVSRYGAWLVCIALALSALGCGGRVTAGTDDPGSGDGNAPPPITPSPTCNDICRHVVDSCFPGGVIDRCARDCEDTRSKFKGCAFLDAFLRCNLTARVLCRDNEAVLDDCYDERDDLSRGCK